MPPGTSLPLHASSSSAFWPRALLHVDSCESAPHSRPTPSAAPCGMRSLGQGEQYARGSHIGLPFQNGTIAEATLCPEQLALHKATGSSRTSRCRPKKPHQDPPHLDHCHCPLQPHTNPLPLLSLVLNLFPRGHRVSGTCKMGQGTAAAGLPRPWTESVIFTWIDQCRTWGYLKGIRSITVVPAQKSSAKEQEVHRLFAKPSSLNGVSSSFSFIRSFICFMKCGNKWSMNPPKVTGYTIL